MKLKPMRVFKGTLFESPQPASETAHSELEKRAIRKLDLLLMPTLGIFFFLSFLDRSNLGNVKVIGLEGDLHMTEHDFSMLITFTFIPYILVEYPSNLILRKVGAGVYLPFLVFAWGLITCLQGLATSYHGLLVARVFLGLAEGGLYPAVLLYLLKFYTRRRIQLRIALFFSSICLSGAMSGLLTFSIMKMDGYLGRKGWSWVFIIEGFFSSIFGIMGFFVLPSTLEDAKLLNHAERSAIAAGLKQENFNFLSHGPSATGSSPRKSISFQAWQALKSPHVVLMSLAKFMKGANGYSLGYFIPTLVKSFGHSPSGTQLLTIPIYVVAFCYIIPLAYLADRYQARGIATCVCTLLSLIGSIIFYVSAIHNLRYGSLFISLAGSYGAVPCLSAWVANNSEPYARKEVALALGPSLGNLGGLMAVWIFAAGRKPRYTLPTVVSIIFSVGILLCTILNMLWLAYAERVKVAKREEILARFMSPLEDADVEPKFPEDSRYSSTGATASYLRATEAWDELGDKHPDFKYSF